MPTDLEALFARKRKARWEKNKESQAVLTMLSVSVIISLVMLVLVFADKSYAQADLWRGYRIIAHVPFGSGY